MEKVSYYMYRQNHYQFNVSFTQTSSPGERSSKTAEWLYFFAMSSGVSLSYIVNLKTRRWLPLISFNHDWVTKCQNYTQTHLVFHIYLTFLSKQQRGDLTAPSPGCIMQRSVSILQGIRGEKGSNNYGKCMYVIPGRNNLIGQAVSCSLRLFIPRSVLKIQKGLDGHNCKPFDNYQVNVILTMSAYHQY